MGFEIRHYSNIIRADSSDVLTIISRDTRYYHYDSRESTRTRRLGLEPTTVVSRNWTEPKNVWPNYYATTSATRWTANGTVTHSSTYNNNNNNNNNNRIDLLLITRCTRDDLGTSIIFAEIRRPNGGVVVQSTCDGGNTRYYVTRARKTAAKLRAFCSVGCR